MANGFSLDEFMGANADFARGYTFYVVINGMGFTDKEKFLVKSSSLPVGTITPIETNWQGNIYKLGGTQEFTDFTVSFNVDLKGDIRVKFSDWQESIHDAESNVHGDPSKYMVDITIYYLSHIDGSVITEYELIKAWPTNVGELALDYTSKEIATFDVTFAYQRHEVTV